MALDLEEARSLGLGNVGARALQLAGAQAPGPDWEAREIHVEFSRPQGCYWVIVICSPRPRADERPPPFVFRWERDSWPWGPLAPDVVFGVVGAWAQGTWGPYWEVAEVREYQAAPGSCGLSVAPAARMPGPLPGGGRLEALEVGPGYERARIVLGEDAVHAILPPWGPSVAVAVRAYVQQVLGPDWRVRMVEEVPGAVLAAPVRAIIIHAERTGGDRHPAPRFVGDRHPAPRFVGDRHPAPRFVGELSRLSAAAPVDEAYRRAEALLRSLLSPAQRAEFAACGWVPVVGSAGGQYRIYPGTASNVHEARPEGHWIIWCAGPRGGLPPGDIMAAQLLHLRYDEPGFRRIANRQGLVPMLDDERARFAPARFAAPA